MERRLLAGDLYKYLLELAAQLQQTGNQEMATRVLFVSKFASGSTSEFYGEAQALLAEFVSADASGISSAEQGKLREVLEGITCEFDRIGGG